VSPADPRYVDKYGEVNDGVYHIDEKRPIGGCVRNHHNGAGMI
jgi:hypothetical protein